MSANTEKRNSQQSPKQKAYNLYLYYQNIWKEHPTGANWTYMQEKLLAWQNMAD